jgi:rhodanese-related sulfurtransferase
MGTALDTSFHSRGCCALLLAMCCGLALAQNAPTSELPKALKNIPPAAAMCRPDKVEPLDSILRGIGRKELPPDLACAISAAELSPAAKRSDTVFVDTRPLSEYNEFRIDGALRMGVSELRGKSYLRGRKIVLVGDGKAERELYVACADLKRQGFKQVRILRGGMASWLVHEQPVVGRAPAPDGLIRLSAAQLWLESQFDRNAVLLADNQFTMLPDLPYSAALGYPSLETIQAALQERRKQMKNAPLASVVLVADAALSREEMLRLQQGLKPVPLLVYVETRQALNRYVATQKAVWAAQARGPKQPNCGT